MSEVTIKASQTILTMVSFGMKRTLCNEVEIVNLNFVFESHTKSARECDGFRL